MNYKGYEIRKGYQEWFIFDSEGRMVQALRTKKECIKVIDYENHKFIVDSTPESIV